MSEAPPSLRLDKWLWVARFFKTRSLAAAAIEGGKIRLNDSHPKSSRDVRPGDIVDIAVGDMRWTVVVQGINLQRRPAAEARLLYEETEANATRRARDAEMRKLAPTPGADIKGGRPTKRAGRAIRQVFG